MAASGSVEPSPAAAIGSSIAVMTPERLVADALGASDGIAAEPASGADAVAARQLREVAFEKEVAADRAFQSGLVRGRHGELMGGTGEGGTAI